MQTVITKMKNFPLDRIKPIHAEFSGDDRDVSIEIILEPFELSIEDYSENVDTSIRLDCIEISNILEELQGKLFQFPVNPDEGYIDGSVYFLSAHNPVDVTEIKFGKIHNNEIPIQLKTLWVLEFENTGFSDFETTINTKIKL
jgi:hypothetical protein